MRRLRLFAIVLAILASPLLIMFILVHQRPSGRMGAVITSPQERRAAAQDVVRRVESLKQAIRSGRRAPVKVEFREDELNAFMDSTPAVQEHLQSRGITNPNVRIDNGSITATGDVAYAGQKFPVTVTGTIVRTDGDRTTFEPQTIRIGKLGAPRRVTEAIAERISSVISSGEAKLPMDVTNVRLENGRLLIEGTTRAD